MKQYKRLFPIILVALVFLGYFSYLSGDFLLDDKSLILRNRVLTREKPLRSIFTTSLQGKPHTYRPLQVLNYVVEYKIWKLNRFGYHLTSIVLHAVNAILVYYLFSLLLPVGLARIVSILFAVHPVNVPVVGYISGRADLLVFFFMLVSIIFVLKFINSRLKIYYLLSIFAGFLAFFCRENSLILFLLIFLTASVNKSGLKKAILLSLPFLALSCIYIILYSLFSRQIVIGLFPVHMSPLFVVINFLNIIPRYLGVLILPLNLHMFRSTEFIQSFLDAKMLSVIVFLALSGYILCKFRRNKPFVLGALWFLIGLIPVLFLLNRYPWLNRAMMAESWLYIPSLGFFLLLALFVHKFSRAGGILLCAYVCLCLYITYQQHIYWNDRIVSYKNILKYLPEKNPKRKHIVIEYLRRGLYDEAFVELNKFARSYPDSSDRYLLEGDYYYAVNNLVKARECYNIALTLGSKKRTIMEKLRKIEVKDGQ